MKKVLVRAPVRADLAGGTLDLWPLYLFHPGARTINVAISFYAESEVATTGDSGIELHLTDSGYRKTYANMQELAADPKAALIYRALEHFRLDGLRITTRTDAPRGSGLGGSSALSITLVRALSEVAGSPVEGVELINLVRDLETRLLAVPAGTQDYYPPVFGGLGALHLEAGAPVRHALKLPVSELAQHMVLHYSEVSHFSGTNNWELYKRHIDGSKKVQAGFRNIADAAIDMERALESGNLEAAGAALAAEWRHRKALIDGISTPEIDAAIEAAETAGAWGGKVCGAGGGGCIVFLFPTDRRDAVLRALRTVPGQTLDAVPVPHGLTIESSGDSSSSHIRSRVHPRATSNMEQLYAYSTSGKYRPWVLGEAIVTHVDARSGLHHSVNRSYAAPIDAEEGSVLWHQARRIDVDGLDLRAVPDPAQDIETPLTPEALEQAASQSEAGLRQMLSETEKLVIYYNPSFDLYSEANESREAFIERCNEAAERQLEDQTERLESTFRRRIDQLRERSEREQREAEKSEDDVMHEPLQDVNVAWGQTLYNITSGRPAAVTDASQTSSVRETDYLENIAQVQRAWDRELQSMRDELNAKARSLEEVPVPVAEKNIEVTRCMILWAGDLA